MDYLFIHFPEIFKYLSSFVIVWGLFACVHLIRLILFANNKRKTPRKEDVYYLTGFAAMTGFSLACLFFYPSFAANNMFTLFMIQFWYSCFAVYYSFTYLLPCTKNCFRKV